MAEEEMPELGLPEEELPMPEEDDIIMEAASYLDDTDSAEDSSGDDINDINGLLDLLSKDYASEDLEETDEETGMDEEPEPTVVSDTSAPEVSLFSDDENDDIFADSASKTPSSVEDVFQDALSAVDYSEKDSEDSEDDGASEDVFALEGDFGHDENAPVAEETIPLAEPVKKAAKKTAQKAAKKEKGPSIWKRIFGNIITEQTAEEEAKERELEKASEEERALAMEEKKKQAAADKEAKAAAAQEEKAKKAAVKAEKAAEKAAAKEEKKRQKAELAATEVVGKINPVGATIVMVFFGLICVTVILGTRAVSYSRSVKSAETQFDQRDYQGAYDALSGVDVSDSLKEMADKIRICMQLQKELNSYTNYYEMKMYLEALDSLMKGIRSYDLNRDKADQYEILSQYNELEGKIASTLFGEFAVSESEARAINSSESQEEYTTKLEEIISRWESKNAEDER